MRTLLVSCEICNAVSNSRYSGSGRGRLRNHGAAVQGPSPAAPVLPPFVAVKKYTISRSKCVFSCTLEGVAASQPLAAPALTQSFFD